MEVKMRSLAGLFLGASLAFSQSVIPFSVVEVSRRFDAAGKLTSESRFLFAMNSDGSIASVDLSPGGGGARQVIDAAKHRSMVINPRSRSAAIMSYDSQVQSPGACEQRFRSIPGVAISVDRSAGNVQGISLERLLVVLPQGIAMDILVAPSLACHMMQIQNRHDGKVSRTQAFERLQLGDPDPRLFEVPADYQVTEGALSR
jgi:hypothetical protein